VVSPKAPEHFVVLSEVTIELGACPPGFALPKDAHLHEGFARKAFACVLRGSSGFYIAGQSVGTLITEEPRERYSDFNVSNNSRGPLIPDEDFAQSWESHFVKIGEWYFPITVVAFCNRL
jgi:hypothetical protein